MGGKIVAREKMKNLSFEESCEQITIFRADFGHCDIPRIFCRSFIGAVVLVQYDKKCVQSNTAWKATGAQSLSRSDRASRRDLSKLRAVHRIKTFEQCCCDLEAFKSEC